ncbi:OmpA family protein [Burkholderia theae]|uniref:OmpA family protein n=1 Tax=Burkholderia theae TaxID=3143496 RepID=UPI003AFB3909
MSGPTFSAWSIDLPNGDTAYRVDCYGLFEGAQTCQRKAEEICVKQPVRVLQGVSALGADGSRRPNVRELTFQCGAAPIPTEPVSRSTATNRAVLRGDATFEFGQAELTAEGRAGLDRLVSDAQGATVDRVTVTGYTDDVGGDTYNARLSERRAAVIAAYLGEHGMHAGQFIVRGRGKADPVASNATAEGRAQNRRVEVLLDSNR